MSHYEARIRRRGEIAKFLDPYDRKLLDGLLAKEARQQVAQMACRAISFYLQRAVQHSAWVRHHGSQVNL